MKKYGQNGIRRTREKIPFYTEWITFIGFVLYQNFVNCKDPLTKIHKITEKTLCCFFVFCDLYFTSRISYGQCIVLIKVKLLRHYLGLLLIN